MADGSWGGGGGKKSKAAAPRNPQKENLRKLARYVKTGNLPVQIESDPTVRGTLRGMSPREVRKAGRQADLPQPLIRMFARAAKNMREGERAGSGLSPVGDALGGASWSVLNETMRNASRPVQTVMSGLSEWSRQGEENPVGPLRIGPVTDPGAIFNAAKEGFLLKRHDTPVSIATQAGKIRESQGESTKSFGVIPGTDLAKGEALPGGAAGKIVYDVGGSIPLDPLTYLTLGVGAAARQGLAQTRRVLGAERALQVAEGGAKVLTAEERTRLGADVVRRLANVKGGVAISRPQPFRAVARGERLLAPPRTVVPVPTAKIGRGFAKVATSGKVGAPGRFLERMFVPRAAVKQGERAGKYAPGTASQLESAGEFYKGSRGADTDLSVLRAIRQKHGLTDAEDFEVAKALDTGTPEGLSPKLRAAYDDYRGRATGFGEELRAGGIIPSEEALAEGRGILDDAYFPHRPSLAESTEQQGSLQLGGPSVRTRAGDPFQRRRGPSLEEKVTRGDVMETRPAAAYAQHAIEGRQALAARGYVDDVMRLRDAEGRPLLQSVDELAESYGLEASEITDASLKQSGLARVKIPQVGEFIAPKDLLPEITKVQRLTSQGDLSTFLKGMDRWMTLWKGYATVPLPFGLGFHMRNGAGNVMLNWLADINPADPAYVQAIKIQKAVSKARKSGVPISEIEGLSATQKAVAQAALDNNVFGGAFFIEDIGQDTLRAYRSGGRQLREASNPLDPNNMLIRAGRAFGLGIEENARLAHFIAKYREFGNFDDAAASVRRYLFDYGDLTAIEQEVFKRFIPFYTFTRKNTPLWVGAAFKQPGKYSRIQEWRSAFFDASNREPQGVTPAYLEEAGGVPLPFDLGGQQTVLAPDLPPTAASETLTPLAKTLKSGDLENLVPLLNQFGGGAPGTMKAFVEAYAANKNFFSGKEFYPGEKGSLGIDARAQHMLEQMFPMLPKILSASEPGEKQKRRIISMLTGVQTYPLGPETQRGEHFRRGSVLDNILAGLRAQGKNVPDYAPTRKKSSSGGSW